MGFRTAYSSVQLKAGIDFVLYSNKPAGRNQSYIRRQEKLFLHAKDYMFELKHDNLEREIQSKHLLLFYQQKGNQ